MNFLAHFHLSGNDNHLAIGNFIGDFMKGIDLKKYPSTIQKGITTHRFIDDFTDSHPLVKQTNKLLNPYFGKYATVVSDIYFDYFLASHFDDYSDIGLRQYTYDVYMLLKSHQEYLPASASRFIHFAFERDIFYEYGNKEGMMHVFNGMANRARFDSKMERGVEILTKHEEELYNLFVDFYPELVEATSQYIATFDN